MGREYTEPYRDAIEAQIKALEWGSEPSAPMCPGLGINECVRELGIPKVSAYATNGYLETGAGEDRAYCSIYGIEGNYSNGRVRVYVLDRGTVLIPLAADVWPVVAAAAA